MITGSIEEGGIITVRVSDTDGVTLGNIDGIFLYRVNTEGDDTLLNGLSNGNASQDESDVIQMFTLPIDDDLAGESIYALVNYTDDDNNVESNIVSTSHVVVDINFPPGDILFIGDGIINNSDSNGATLSLEENQSGSFAYLDITDIDSPVSDLSYRIISVSGVGVNAGDFDVDEASGSLRTTGLDFELVTGDITIEIEASDGNGKRVESIVISLIDINEEPTITVSNAILSLAETTDVTNPIKVADINILDDAIGDEVITISGVDASFFELSDDGTELLLKSGVSLTTGELVITLEIDDLSIGASIENSVEYTLNILTSNSILDFSGVQQIVEGGTTISGTYVLTDPDGTDSLSTINGTDITTSSFNGLFGVLNLSGTTYTYVLDNELPATLSLELGQRMIDRFSFVTDDGIMRDLEITVIGVNSPPTDIVFLGDVTNNENKIGATLNLDENSSGTLATLTVEDSDTASFTFSILSVVGDGISSDDFYIDIGTGELILLDPGFNYESIMGTDIELTIAVSDGDNQYSENLVIVINDINETPSDIEFIGSRVTNLEDGNGATLTLEENFVGVIATLNLLDEDDSIFSYNILSVVGDANVDDFSINPVTGALSTVNNGLDFESISGEIVLTIEVQDSVDNSYTENVTVSVTNEDDRASISLFDTRIFLDVNSDVSSRIRIANIVILDEDSSEVNNLSLSGSDASDFEIIGTQLYLKADTNLFGVENLNVTVDVGEVDLAISREDSLSLSLFVGSVDIYGYRISSANSSPTEHSIYEVDIFTNDLITDRLGEVQFDDTVEGNFAEGEGTNNLNDGNDGTQVSGLIGTGEFLDVFDSSSTLDTTNGYTIRLYAEGSQASQLNNLEVSLLTLDSQSDSDSFPNEVGETSIISGVSDGADSSVYISFDSNGQIITDAVIFPQSFISGQNKTVIILQDASPIVIGKINEFIDGNPNFSFVEGGSTLNVIDNGEIIGNLAIDNSNDIIFTPISSGNVNNFRVQVTTGATISAEARFNFIVERVVQPTNITFSSGTLGFNFTDLGGSDGARIDLVADTSGELFTALSVLDNVSFTLDDNALAIGFSINSLTGSVSAPNIGFDSNLLGEDRQIELTVTVFSEQGFSHSEVVTVNLVAMNQPPSAIILSNEVTSLVFLEDSSLTRVRVADITIVDDQLGNETVTLSGESAARFELSSDNSQLFLKEDIAINEGDIYRVTINVEDETLESPPLTEEFILRIVRNPSSFILNNLNLNGNNRNLSPSTISVFQALEDVINEDVDVTQEDRETLQTLINTFTTSSLDEQEDLVEEISPVVHTTIAPVVETIVTDVVKTLDTRSLKSIESLSFFINGPNGEDSSENLNTGNIWYDFVYSSGERDENLNVPGYEYSGYSIRGGYERLYQSVFLGASFSYNSSSIENSENRGSVDVSTIGISVYGNYTESNSFYSTAFVLAFSDLDVSRSRNILGNLTGDTSSTAIDLDFTYGLIQQLKEYSLTYLVGFRYSTMSFDDIIEQGESGLPVTTQLGSYDNLFFKLGTIFSLDFQSEAETKKKLFLQAEYYSNLFDLNRNVSSQFTSGGDSFEINGTDESKNTFSLGLGYKFIRKSMIYELGYNYRFSSISRNSNLVFRIRHTF